MRRRIVPLVFVIVMVYLLYPYIRGELDHMLTPPHLHGGRANATFMMLTRNNELAGAIESIDSLEEHFNRKHHYPYVFLNDEPFTEEFKEGILAHTNSTVEFGLVPPEFWVQPAHIDEAKATAARKKMEEDNVKYGGSVSYRNMCRFNSGFFYRHELMKKYRYYWRVEPEIKYHCMMEDNDPFLYMQENQKVYGWVITPTDIEQTIHTLWDHVKDFIKLNPQYLAKRNAMEFLSKDGGKTYNTCHFWSNFEIADMDFYRSKAYSDYFSYLDSIGGFYYERWGDAPVHSIAVSLFVEPEKIHFFDNIGYYHGGWTRCPVDKTLYKKGKCTCDPEHSFDNDYWSCKGGWDSFMRQASMSRWSPFRGIWKDKEKI